MELNLSIKVPTQMESLKVIIKSAGEVAYMNAWRLYKEVTEQKIEPPAYMSPSISKATPKGDMSPLVIENKNTKLKISIPVITKTVSFGSVSTVEITPRESGEDSEEPKEEMDPGTPRF
jgi:hypothetical protein